LVTSLNFRFTNPRHSRDVPRVVNTKESKRRMFNFFKEKQQPEDGSESTAKSEQSYEKRRLHYESIKTITVDELKELQEKAMHPTVAVKQLEILHEQGLNDLKQYIGEITIIEYDVDKALNSVGLRLDRDLRYCRESSTPNVYGLIETFLSHVLQNKKQNLPEVKSYNQHNFILEKVTSRIASGDLIVECVKGESTDDNKVHSC